MGFTRRVIVIFFSGNFLIEFSSLQTQNLFLIGSVTSLWSSWSSVGRSVCHNFLKGREVTQHFHAHIRVSLLLLIKLCIRSQRTKLHITLFQLALHALITLSVVGQGNEYMHYISYLLRIDRTRNSNKTSA